MTQTKQRPLQILIVDDDMQIRIGLENILYHHFTPEEITIFSCTDGEMAAQILRQKSIDFLLSDIKMPIVSGIELLKIVKECHYHCYSIVLSGYDDFNLVRDAMRLGAVDYLLKPIDEDLLIHHIKEASQSIHRETQLSASGNPFFSDMLLKQKIVESMLDSSSPLVPEATKYVTDHHITPETPCIICQVDIRRALYSNHIMLFQFLAEQVAQYQALLPETLQKNSTLIYGGIDNFWILLLFSTETLYTPEQFFSPFFQLLTKNKLHYSYTDTWYTYHSLASAYVHSRNGFEKYYFNLPIKKIHGEVSVESLRNWIEKAAIATASYDCENAVKYLLNGLYILNVLRPEITECKKILNQFVYSLLNQNAIWIPVISATKFTPYDILEHIEVSENLSILAKNLCKSVEYIIQTQLQTNGNKDDHVIQKAKDYIHNHYQNGITLEEVASYVFMNENYFSTLFRKKSGTTFRDYLKNYRIEKAKKLLVTTDLPIYEIAAQVGYNEPAHFVRAFKSITNKSPSDYRKKKSS